MNKKLQLALIGLGYMGRFHLEKLQQLDEYAECVAIIDVDEKKRNSILKTPSLKIVSADIKDALPFIEAALITTPTSEHYEAVKLLLENDKHVFCEKPLTADTKQVHSLKDLDSSDLIVQIGHSERYHPIWKDMEYYRHFFENACTIRINRHAPFKDRGSDVDVVFDLMIHDLDILYMLFGKRPQVVSARGYKIRTNNWDHVTAQLSIDDAYIYMVAGRNHVKKDRSWEIVSKQGCLYLDLLHNKVHVSDGEKISCKQYEKKDHLFMEQKDYYLAIKGLKPSPINLTEGIRAVEMASDVINHLS